MAYPQEVINIHATLFPFVVENAALESYMATKDADWHVCVTFANKCVLHLIALRRNHVCLDGNVFDSWLLDKMDDLIFKYHAMVTACLEEQLDGFKDVMCEINAALNVFM
jgi:hypothetical protein